MFASSACRRYQFLLASFAALLVGIFAGCLPPPQARAPIVAVIETSEGNIKLHLDGQRSPTAVDNFVKYARSGYYDGTIFHRVIDGFMIQGGGHLPDLSRRQEPFLPIENEAKNGLKNRAMTIAFARGDDPNSALAQFYINQVDNEHLDYTTGESAGYTVFGTVIEGQQVVHSIAETATHSVDVFENLPTKDIMIHRITIDQSAS